MVRSTWQSGSSKSLSFANFDSWGNPSNDSQQMISSDSKDSNSPDLVSQQDFPIQTDTSFLDSSSMID